jgi:uncharacterized protein (UPF0218 family)/phosphopantetheine adenylyltransferase
MRKKYNHLVLAGTFDHFHKGHQYFINSALSHTKKLSCGITTGWANKGKVLKQNIQNLSLRTKAFNNHLKQHKISSHVHWFYLHNPVGPAITNQFDALAVTQDSLNGAKLVNQTRKANNAKPLPIVLVDLIQAQDQQKISSSRIRLGQIRRDGFVYHHIFKHSRTFYLPDQKRYLFKKPIGKLISGSLTNFNWAFKKALTYLNRSKPSFIVTVGDIATQSFVQNNLWPNLSIYDYRCQRRPISFNLHLQLKKTAGFIFNAVNQPGTISKAAIASIEQSLIKILNQNQSGIIQIKGEEDLLVLPLIILLPLNTAIFYGQPFQGLVKIRVTEKTKQKALNLLKNFSPG